MNDVMMPMAFQHLGHQVSFDPQEFPSQVLQLGEVKLPGFRPVMLVTDGMAECDDGHMGSVVGTGVNDQLQGVVVFQRDAPALQFDFRRHHGRRVQGGVFVAHRPEKIIPDLLLGHTPGGWTPEIQAF